MSKETLITTLGLLTAVTPFLGVPIEIKTWIFVALGIGIALAAFLVRRERRRRDRVRAKRTTATRVPTEVHVVREQPAPESELLPIIEAEIIASVPTFISPTPRKPRVRTMAARVPRAPRRRVKKAEEPVVVEL